MPETVLPRPPPDPLLEALWEKGLILLGDRVRREYALKTPIFIDLRHKLYDDLDLLSQLGRALFRKLESLVKAERETEPQPQQVIGIPDTATPLALSMALASHKTPFKLSYGQLRKSPANYPGGERGVSAYMGVRSADREITLVDDVMASGRTKRWAIGELRKDGLEVKRILVVVDREQGGNEAYALQNCTFHSLYKVTEVIEYYVAAGKVDSATAQAALDHIRCHQFRERGT